MDTHSRKKVGIVGWGARGGQNYGTSLQAFALFYRIEKEGYDVSYISSPLNCKRIWNSFRYRFRKLLGSQPKECGHKGMDPSKLNKIGSFMRSNIPVSPSTLMPFSFRRYINQYSCIVTGSDQIWNPHHLSRFCLLEDFPDSVKRISYSSSVGVDSLPDNVVPLYKRALSRFSHLSLREFSGVEMVSSLLKRNDVQKVLDPVFLLSNEDWDEVVRRDSSSSDFKKRPYIFCYFVGDNDWYWKEVLRIKQQMNYKGEIRIAPLESTHYRKEHILCETAGVGDFVRLIRDADLILTDSFHATVLSIIYRKQFVEFLRFEKTDSASQNSRLTELLDRYALNKQWYDKDGDDYLQSIDYKKVYSILNKDIKDSEAFLFNSIEN